MVVKPSIAGHGHEVGDMVWAKMKSQPWWPGHVYNEELATPLVRRSKREGLLLVAFFGASSYAWFDPSELLPFDSNYAEKSLQTDSKTFAKAMEEAIREVNRRIDLGLSCMCGNNKLNFRETDVQGFVSVDVAGYDPGAVYSIDVIEKARVSFQPKSTLDFLSQLALEPTDSEHGDINFMKNKATVMSYRKAVYEVFDQAFGYDSVRASIQESPLQKVSSKAPLSGGEVMNTAKLKSHFKKDEIKEIKEEKEEVTSSSLPVPFKDPTIAAGELSSTCVEMSTSIVESSKKTGQPEGDGNHKMEVSRVLSDLLSLAVDPFNIVNRGSCINGRKAFLRFRSLVFQKGQNFSLRLTGDELSASKFPEDSVEVPPVKQLGGLRRGPSLRLEEMAAAKRKKVCDISNLTKEKKVTKKIDEPPVPIRDLKHQAAAVAIKKPGPEPTMLLMKFPQGGSLPSLSELNSRFACYGPLDRSATQIYRNTFSCRLVFEHKAHAQAAYRFVVGCSSLFGNTYVKCRLKEAGNVGAAEPGPPVIVPQEDHHQPAMEEGSLSCILSDLQSLAVDPFNTTNSGSHVLGKKAFLKFRSLAFKKNHSFSLPLANGEPNAGKLSEDHVEVPPVKPQGGLKHRLSDHQEEMEMAVTKRKKVCDIKILTKEKKVTKKIDEPPARDVNQPVATALKKPGPELIKKTEHRAPEPTMLMIKFPKGGSLPSFKELKARFASYGPMDHSGTHIFWNTFTCQVVFRYKGHAQAAYRSVVESNSLFGNTGVKCTLKAVGIVGSAEPEPLVKVPKEDLNQADMEDRPLTMVPVTSGVELKSILKKSGGEEVEDSSVRGRVKFVLGQMKNNMENKTSHLTTDFSKNFQKAADPSGVVLGQMKNNMENKTYLTTDFSKNFQKAADPSVVTCTRGPSPPPPTHYGTPLVAPSSLPPHSMQMTTLRVLNKPLNTPPLMTPNTDIAQQMLSLLTRCNDVVMNVSSILGYSPYHPL